MQHPDEPVGVGVLRHVPALGPCVFQGLNVQTQETCLFQAPSDDGAAEILDAIGAGVATLAIVPAWAIGMAVHPN